MPNKRKLLEVAAGTRYLKPASVPSLSRLYAGHGQSEHLQHLLHGVDRADKLGEGVIVFLAQYLPDLVY